MAEPALGRRPRAWIPERWTTPVAFLVLASVAMPLGFAAWQALLNNFAIEQAAFTGREIGWLQSLREVPGFLAFTAIFVILVLREQTFAVLAVAVFGVGVALTGYFPTEYGLYCTTVLMSVGFHYFETIRQSLSLQWLTKEEAPRILGRLIAVGSATSLAAYAAMYVVLKCSRFPIASSTWRLAAWPSQSPSPLPASRTFRPRPRNARRSCCAAATGCTTGSRSSPAPGGRYSSSSPAS